MTRVFSVLFLSLMSYACRAQGSVDLEKLTFKENARVLVKNHKKSADRAEPLTSLPAYTTYDIAGYHFGPVALQEHCFVSFLLNSIEEKKLVGLLIGFETDASSKAINKYVFARYGKPVVLEQEIVKTDRNQKPYPSSSAYLWKNIKPGISFLLSKSYVVENGKRVENTDVVLIANDVKPSYQTNFATVLARIIKTYQ
jgi:hypothetical protein